MARVGELYDSKYAVDEEFNPGSVGQSYLCRSEIWPDKKLVLKTIHSDFLHMPGFSQSFGLVAKSLANLKIPQLVQVLELGKYNGELYYVSPFIEGKSLRRWMKETLNFEERILTGLETLKKLSQLLKKMEEANCFAFLKPENIILNDGQVYLKEFWIAGYIPVSFFEKNVAAAHYLPYVAPELKEDWGSNTPSGHCYALGAMLYEILVGKAPLGKIKLPSAFSNIYNRDVDNIILSFLAKNPSQRIYRLEDIQKALNHLLLTFIPTKNKRPDIEDEWHEQSLGESVSVSHMSHAPNNNGKMESGVMPKQQSPSALDSMRAMEDDFENEEDDIDTQVIDHLALKKQLKEQDSVIEPYLPEEDSAVTEIASSPPEEPKIMPPQLNLRKSETQNEAPGPKRNDNKAFAVEKPTSRPDSKLQKKAGKMEEDDPYSETQEEVYTSPLEDTVVEKAAVNKPAPDILRNQKKQPKPSLPKMDTEIEEEEEEEPKVPTAVKIILALAGVIIVGGAIFLGFSQAVSWK